MTDRREYRMTYEEKVKKYVKEKINDMKVGNIKLMEISHLSNGADIYNPKVEHLLQDKIKQAYLDGLAEGEKVGFEDGYKKATERAYERQKDLTETYIKDGEKIQKLGEENEELKKNQINWVLDSIPEDKEALCIIKDKDGYYIDSFNNLSSTDQKNIEKWAYLPL